MQLRLPEPLAYSIYRNKSNLSKRRPPVAFDSSSCTIKIQNPKSKIEFEPITFPISVYRLSPNEAPWEIVHDLLNDRTGLKTHTGGSTSNYAKLEVWASNRNPGEVVATGKHNRRIVRSDGVITVDTCCTVRSTETAFHLTIDLYITVNDLPHHQKRWMRTFPRVLL